MAHGACDYCGNSIAECECSKMVEFEVSLMAGKPLIFDVRMVFQEDGERIVVAFGEEPDSRILNSQQRRVFFQMYEDQKGHSLYNRIQEISQRLI